MERKKALLSAAVVSGAVFVAGAGIGLNTGLLSSEAEENPVGQLQVDDLIGDPTTTTTADTTPETIVIDEYVTDGPPAATGGSSGASPSGTAGAAVAPAPARDVPSVAAGVESPRSGVTSVDDDEYEHDEFDDDEFDDDEYEHEEYEEYEGYEDDD